VSDRLIDRMDQMLGRPEVDPHGDPIPDPEGVVKMQPSHTLLTCPLRTPVTITRVIDQDKVFLRFIENHHLKPGESIEVEDRDAASDSVRVRGKDDQRITIGTRAASKLLVRLAATIVLALVGASAARAQNQPFEILDNSFLVEEAFNQEPGIFQNIFGLRHDGDAGEAGFTQEWPLFTQTHQFSFTVAAFGLDRSWAFGDVMVNYRWQASMESAARPAFSPRLSIILPSGDAAKGFGEGSPGWQVNLPFSKQFGDAYLHWNAGFTHLPNADGDSTEHNLFTPHVAMSGIWRLRPMFNLMLETVFAWDEFIAGAGEERDRVVTLSPGFRTGWNSGDNQTIFGLAVPVTFAGGKADPGVFGYFSHELPFTPR
jgi:hypothetical protein